MKVDLFLRTLSALKQQFFFLVFLFLLLMLLFYFLFNFILLLKNRYLYIFFFALFCSYALLSGCNDDCLGGYKNFPLLLQNVFERRFSLENIESMKHTVVQHITIYMEIIKKKRKLKSWSIICEKIRVLKCQNRKIICVK